MSARVLLTGLLLALGGAPPVAPKASPKLTKVRHHMAIGSCAVGIGAAREILELSKIPEEEMLRRCLDALRAPPAWDSIDQTRKPRDAGCHLGATIVFVDLGHVETMPAVPFRRSQDLCQQVVLALMREGA
jgi:hypothetical protein